MKQFKTFNIALVLLVCMILFLQGGCTRARASQAEDRRPQHIAGGTSVGEINLLAMGDWGNGSSRQKAVANSLRDYVRNSGQKFDGILLAGDNFYVRLRGVDDPQWRTLFENMYDKNVLDFPFYAVLGNHDYERGKDTTQLAYARQNSDSRWTMPARWYRIDFPAENPLVTVLMLDSNRGRLRRTLWNAQNQWLRDQLAARETLGQWVIACAHHPIFSNGSHGDNAALQRAWGGLLEAHGVDFYLCGHDHDLQHLQLTGWEMSFLLAGGGGAGVRPMRRHDRGPFSRAVHGFAHLNLTPQRATVTFMNMHGNVVHAFQRDANGNVRVLETTGQDPAQPGRSPSRRSPPAISEPPAATAPSP